MGLLPSFGRPHQAAHRSAQLPWYRGVCSGAPPSHQRRAPLGVELSPSCAAGLHRRTVQRAHMCRGHVRRCATAKPQPESHRGQHTTRMTQPVAAVAQRHRRCVVRLIRTMCMDRHPPQQTSPPPQPAAALRESCSARTSCVAACRCACAPEDDRRAASLLCGGKASVVSPRSCALFGGANTSSSSTGSAMSGRGG